MYSDADLARELRERRSTTSLALLPNEVAIHCDISKQGESTGATTREPSTVYEDNAGTTKGITTERITPTHRQHGVKISSVMYHKQKGTIAVTYSKSDLVLADPKSKPHRGKTLRMKID
eukprot:13306731-Ditylum_brightwellii.AAC.2